MTQIANFTSPVVTKTSLELVEYINRDREQKAKQAEQDFPSKGFAKLEHADFIKKVPEVLGEHAGNFSGMFDVVVGNGAVRKSPGYIFPKREACLMAMSYSYELQAKVFDEMTRLEDNQTIPIDPANRSISIAAAIADALRMSDSARLGIVVKALKMTAPEFLPMLPSYAVDAPKLVNGVMPTSSEQALSLTALLKLTDKPFSVRQFNVQLLAGGFMETVFRASAKVDGQKRSYYVITEKGMYYGKNMTHPNNQNETQPVWFVSTFDKLRKEVGL